jgi:uncharacterized membrane protein
VGVLIYFIHHITSEIRVENVIDALAAELYGSTDEFFSDNPGERPENDIGEGKSKVPSDLDRHALDVQAQADGYIRHINEADLIAVAAAQDLVVRLNRRPGDYVIDADVLISVYPRERADRDIVERLRQSVVIGPTRTPLQDPVFAQQQLVEIGVRALSAAFNDHLTAQACIDRLGQGLCRFARRKPPSPHRYDDAGGLRMIIQPVTLVEMANAAFMPVARSARQHIDVVLSLLRAVLLVAEGARDPSDRAHLIGLAETIRADAESLTKSEWDKDVLARTFGDLAARLHSDGGLTGTRPQSLAS